MSDSVATAITQTATAATAFTTVAATFCGVLENRNAAAPVNAVSHIAFGDKAARQDAVSMQYTGVGAALNSAAMVSWAGFHHLVFRPHQRRASFADAFVRGAVTAAIAYVVDYHVVPKRLTPGFEKRLSNRSLFVIYAALAAGLALGDQLSQRAAAARQISGPAV